MSWEWVPPTAVALLALMEAWRARNKVQRLHLEVNSRLSQLLRATAAEATSLGHAKGVKDERKRRDDGNDKHRRLP